MAAVLEGLDAIVFCGGIGENASAVREYIIEAMEWLASSWIAIATGPAPS
jgi:acetate kinase